MRTSTLVTPTTITRSNGYTATHDCLRPGAGCLRSDPPVLAPGPLAAAPVYDDDADWINAVAVKLPELWQSKVRGWFAQAEAQFATSGISSSLTKYYHVIKALPESSIERIPELLIPSADDPYSMLRDRLMELYDFIVYNVNFLRHHLQLRLCLHLHLHHRLHLRPHQRPQSPHRRHKGP